MMMMMMMMMMMILVVMMVRTVQRGPHPPQLWGGPGLLGARSPWPKDKSVQKKALQRAKQPPKK